MERIKKAPDKLCLETVYAEQMGWARHFNELIWTVGSIVIPASLAGLTFDFKNDANVLDETTLAMTAIGSSLLLLFFLLFAEWHRKLWRRSYALAGLVEVEWGLREKTKQLPADLDRHILSQLTPMDWGLHLRRGLVWFGSLIWTCKWAIALSGWPPKWCDFWPPNKNLVFAHFLFFLVVFLYWLRGLILPSSPLYRPNTSTPEDQ
jgi:hypothetical protein